MSAKNTILIADDSLFYRIALREMMEQKGFKVIDAKDGLEGLRVWEENSPEIILVIADYEMPGLNGLEMIKEARARGLQTQAVILSGYAKENGVEVPWIEKSIDPSGLCSIVDSIRNVC